jgi:uncharacterized DUF497 family protein
VEIEFDPKKSAKNAKERGLPFERFADLDLEAGAVTPDTRRDYSEDRFLMTAPWTDGCVSPASAYAAPVTGSSASAKQTIER